MVTRISSPADWKVTGEFVDGAAEALGEEAAAGMAQPGLGLAAAMIDRQRIGIDQRLPHGLRRDRAVGERSAMDAVRQRGIAVAAGDLGDGADDLAQHLLAAPRRGDRADERGGQSEKQASGAPGDQHGDGTGSDERQYDPSRQRVFMKIGGHFRLTSADAGKSPGGHE